jgi:2-polyprenyl-6-methoxyphenol hydroxylase-like FAD-dependent oxidoreductase
MEHAPRTRILILGGGFAGLTVGMELEKKLAQDPSVEITLINRENFFLFTPTFHEVAAGDLDLTTIVNPVRKMLRRVHFFAGEVSQIDIEQKESRRFPWLRSSSSHARVRFPCSRAGFGHESLWASGAAGTRPDNEVARRC